MKHRFLALLLWPSLLALCGTLGLARPGLSPQGPGLNSSIATPAGGSVTVTYIGNRTAEDSYNSGTTTFTYNSVGIGTAAAGRTVALAVAGSYPGGDGDDISAIVINGVSAARQLHGNRFTYQADIWTASVPTGTSVTITVQIDGNVNTWITGFAVYTILGAASNTPSVTATSTAKPATNGSYSVPAGGGSIGWVMGSTAPGVTWTGITSDAAVVINGVQADAASASNQTGGATLMQVDWAFDPGGQIAVFASWSP